MPFTSATRVTRSARFPDPRLSGIALRFPETRTSTPPAQAGEAFHTADFFSRRANKHVEVRSNAEQVTLDQTGREQAARSALREIELDYQLGNITEADYRTLRERYVRRALGALKSRYEREQELDEAIEVQLRQMREKNDNAN